MVNFNLLACTKSSYLVSRSKRVLYFLLFLVIICGIIYIIKQHDRQIIEQKLAENKRLEYEIDSLKKQKLRTIKAVEVDSISADDVKNAHFKSFKKRTLMSAFLQINYAKASDLAALLKDNKNELLSADGSIIVDQRTNVIWVEDHSKNISAIKTWMKRLDVASKQVEIEARIVNMTKECAEDLGVRFGLSRLNQGVPAANNGNNTNGLNLDLSATPLDGTPATVGVALSTIGTKVLLDVELSALESEGLAEIIASPRLLTTNQEAAVIESGEDIPYQEYTASGATSVAFKKAVLSLKVVPQITADGKLIMELLINQGSDSGRRVQGVPIIITKSIVTKVLVHNGQTIVLGGINKQDQNNGKQSVPFFGKLPILGQLLTRKQIRSQREELIIFITPKIIN